MAGFLARFRLPVRNGLVQVQRVKFTSKSRLSTTFLWTSALLLILSCPTPERILPPQVEEILRKHMKRSDTNYGNTWQKERRRLEELDEQRGKAILSPGSGEGKDNMGTQKVAIFIPLTMLREREREYYCASDPEWQEYVALSKDVKRMKEVKSQLSNVVCKHVSNFPLITRTTGKPLTVRTTWLDFKFPQIAPVEYERSGILWVDNQIKWTAKRYDDRQAQRIYRIIFPTALFSSLQGLSSNLMTSHYGTLKSLWSRSDAPKAPKIQTSTETSLQTSLPPSTGQNESKSASLANVQKRPGDAQQAFSLATAPISHAELIRTIMPESEPDSAIAAAVKSFKLHFLRQWTKSQYFDIRGACVLKGEVAMNGPNGRCKVSVQALYLPKENRFGHITLTTIDTWAKTQSPLGKPKPGRNSKP